VGKLPVLLSLDRPAGRRRSPGGSARVVAHRPVVAIATAAVVFGLALAGGSGSASGGARWSGPTVEGLVTLTAVPPALTNQTTATLAFTSKPLAKKYKCRLDSARFTACTSPQVYTGLSDGVHEFAVVAPSVVKEPTTYTWSVDTIPPGEVRRLRRSLEYRRIQLRWTRPPDGDFDHVEVYASSSPRSQPRTLVYRGSGHTYSTKRFKNGLYHRYRIVSVDRAKNASKGASTTIRPSALLRWPGDGRVVHQPPLLRWTPVRGATFYNVQVHRQGKKIVSAWPRKARLALRRRWSYGGRRLTLARGLYVWYVWPAFGSSAGGHYGQLLGQAAFRVR
jgi:hypothetical protein